MLAVYPTIARDIARNYLQRQAPAITYIREPAPWVITSIGEKLAHYAAECKVRYYITSSIYGLPPDTILHFGSLNAYLAQPLPLRTAQRCIVTVFHIDTHDPRRQSLPRALRDVAIIHTASTATRDDLVSLGIKKNKLVVIPLGVDTELFHPATTQQTKNLRHRLGIATDVTLIGSFQKDGSGWRDGNTPKFIKGPDILTETLHQLHQAHQIHVLLSGPARGYVVQRLRQKNIPITYVGFLPQPNAVAALYQALDLYLITARVEGGPQQLLEAWASGVPVVTTRVGMVNDLAKNHSNAIIVDAPDSTALSLAASELLKNTPMLHRLQNAGPQIAQHYSWPVIAELYMKKLYLPLLPKVT